MSDIPLRALTGRKNPNLNSSGYTPLNTEGHHHDEQHRGSSRTMAAVRLAATAAASYHTRKKGKGRQQHYRDDDAEEEENLLSRGEYGDDNDGDETAVETTLLRREPSVESVSCT